MEINLFSLALLIVVASAANPRIGFSIGTSATAEDIVKDGVTQPPYNNGLNSFAVPIGQYQMTWFEHFNTSTNVGNHTQFFNITFSTGAGIIAPIYTLTGTGLNGTADYSYAETTDFLFTCNDFGTDSSRIVISVPPYDEIVVYVQHLCQRANYFNLAYVSGAVGNQAAILDGEPNPRWSFESDDGQPFTTFYAWLTATHEPPPQTYTVTLDYDTTIGLETDILSMNWVATDSQDVVSDFEIHYSCPAAAAPIVIPINVHIFTGWHKTFDFSFIKKCGVTMPHRIGMMVGLEKNGSEVVVDGVVQPSWNSSNYYSYVAGDISQTFWFWLSPGKPNDEQNYLIQISATDGFTVTGDQFQGVMKTPLEGPEHDIAITFHFLCLKDTNVTFKIEIAMTNWASPILHFQKRCADPQLDIGVYESNDNRATLVPTLVHHNVASPNITTINSDQATSDFFIWIPRSYAAITPYQQFAIKSFHFDDAYLNAEYKVMKSDKAHVSDYVKGTSFLRVTYRCSTPPDVSTSFLNFTITIGWQQDITFQWQKHCDSRVTAQPSGGHSAWTPFGIFAFTVFMLILVWCLFGCAYNYVAKDQRGADAIPGITLYRSVYHRCFPTPKYTPQTDYNYSERESPDYGGTSYQSENL